MKKTILTLALLGSTNAFAFGVQLENSQVVTVEELEGTGATHVSCSDEQPRCILLDTEYGIQYPGQAFGDVVLTNTYNSVKAIKYVKELKEQGLCQ